MYGYSNITMYSSRFHSELPPSLRQKHQYSYIGACSCFNRMIFQQNELIESPPLSNSNELVQNRIHSLRNHRFLLPPNEITKVNTTINREPVFRPKSFPSPNNFSNKKKTPPFPYNRGLIPKFFFLSPVSIYTTAVNTALKTPLLRNWHFSPLVVMSSTPSNNVSEKPEEETVEVIDVPENTYPSLQDGRKLLGIPTREFDKLYVSSHFPMCFGDLYW